MKGDSPKTNKWIWIQFADKQPSEVTRLLAELAFHWNRARQTWQHPCGLYRDVAATFDPRQKYGRYFAADVSLFERTYVQELRSYTAALA